MEGDALIEAILRAVDGDSVVAPEMMNKLVAAYRGSRQAPPALIAGLSPRELDVLRGIAHGVSNKEIARQHGIAETTVKIHVQHLLRKLNVSSRVYAAVIASENGVVLAPALPSPPGNRGDAGPDPPGPLRFDRGIFFSARRAGEINRALQVYKIRGL